MSSPVRIIETSYVSAPATTAPPPGPIKLNAMEALWVSLPLLQHVLLFDLEGADMPLFDTIVESLRCSLAATLGTFGPLAGKLVHLKDTGDVAISCSASDGVMFVIAESDADISRLAGDEQHDLGVLERLVPKVDMTELPTALLAVQATRFEAGFAVGLTAHHAVMDGRSLWAFVQAWAASCRGETPVMVPTFDRSLVSLPGGHDLASSVLRKFAPNLPSAKTAWSMKEDHRQFSRRTFALDATRIERLKRRIVHLGETHGAPLSSWCKSYSSIGPMYKAFIAALDSAVPIPRDWQEAKRYPQWRAAMLEEMAALDKNGTWELSTLPIGNDEQEMVQLKKDLAKSFEVKDLGYLHYFLGIEVAYGAQGIYLSQRKYTLDLLKETRMMDCKPIATPIEQNHNIKADSGEPVDKMRFQRLVGRLIYLSHTRPDITYAVSVISRYMHDPRTSHMNAVNRILRYLKGSPGKGIMFSNYGHLNVEGFTDADWAGSIDDRKSTSGYCVFVGGNIVSWRSKKQSVVARSTAEAEFRSMALDICELLWVKILLSELQLFNGVPLKLYCDNQATINIVNNPIHHDRTKHVGIDRHFIKEKLEVGVLQVVYVKSSDQLADILTKGIDVVSFMKLCNKMRLCDIFASS